MAGGGSKPGERRGGRKKGVPNKLTVQRREIAAEIAARTVEQARITGKKLAKEVLDDFMHLFAGMAAVSQPLPPGMLAQPGHTPNEARFEKWARLAVETARALAPYQSATFRAVIVAPAPDANEPERRRRFSLTIFEGGRATGVADVEPIPTKPAGTVPQKVQ